jgi:L,D-peptidoglycan transpeptidase YkuD (ErfK/YbiS/YcfS/YnhG family)
MRIRGRDIIERFSRLRLRWKIIWTAVALGAIASITVAVAMMTAEGPPADAFEMARDALARARKAEAARYAPQLLRGAEARLEEARFAWQMENLKWSPRRDFTRTHDLSLDAVRRAERAEKRAVAVRDSLKAFTNSRLGHVAGMIQAFQSYYKDVPISEAHRRSATKSEVLVNEARAAFTRGDYIKSAAKIQDAARLIDSAASSSEEFIDGYMSSLSQWRRWANETIAWSSREKKVAIVVDKMARACRVYKSGRLAVEYPIELGSNWIGDKRLRGDMATPEGRYHVRKKKGAGQTKYHRALEIDYPNETDMKWFREAKRSGELPAHAKIGGVIEIHGDGGKGENWTEGCVALRNDHMEKVFALAAVGTPVTIVGALEMDALEKNNHNRRANGN